MSRYLCYKNETQLAVLRCALTSNLAVAKKARCDSRFLQASPEAKAHCEKLNEMVEANETLLNCLPKGFEP